MEERHEAIETTQIEGMEVEGFRKHPDAAPRYRISVTTKDDGQISLTVKSGAEVIETYGASTVALLVQAVNSQSTAIMIDDALATKISDSLKIEAITKKIAAKRASVRSTFAEIVKVARSEDASEVERAEAVRKLSVFEKHLGPKRAVVTGGDGVAHTGPNTGGYDNQEMAMKLATMNRAGRQAYFSDLRTERGDLKRAAARKKTRDARKAKRRRG